MLRKPVTLRAADEGEIRLPQECLQGLGVEAGSRGVVQIFQQRMLLVPLREVPAVQRDRGVRRGDGDGRRGAGAAARRHATAAG